MADSYRERFAATDSDSVASDASLSGIYRWGFEMENLGDVPITSPSTVITTLQPPEHFVYFEPNPDSIVSNTFTWNTFPDISVEVGYGADIYMESDIPVTFSPGFDSARTVSPLQITSDHATQTITVAVTPQVIYRRINVQISTADTDLTSGTFVSASPTPTPDVSDDGCAGAGDFETAPDHVAWNCLGAQVGTTYTFTAQFSVQNKAYPAVVEYEPRVRVHGQRISLGQAQGSSLTLTDTVLGTITYSADPAYGPYSWNYNARDRWLVVYPQKSELVAQPSILADGVGESKYYTDADAVPDASLTGVRTWEFWMDDTGSIPVQNPAISVLTQDPTSASWYFDPTPDNPNPTGPPYRYDWSFSDIAAADAYVESSLPVTYSPGFDSSRTVTPMQISSDHLIQTVTVTVTPHEAFDRILVHIFEDETDLVRGTYVASSASPVPSTDQQGRGYVFGSGANYVVWDYPEVNVGTTYQFTAQFLVENKAYPNVVVYEPRVRVHGQYNRQDLPNLATGGSLTRTASEDSVISLLGDVTFSAAGSNMWSYLSQENKVVRYNVKSIRTSQLAVKVKLLDSNGNGLSGGVVQYYSAGWHPFGTTGTDGTASMALAPGTYTFQISYGGGIQQLSQNVANNPVVVFQTTLVTMSLVSSTNAQLSGGAQYYAGGWHAFGGGTTTTTMELLPLTYTFQVIYGGGTQQKSQNVVTNPNVVFQTTLVTMQLVSSTNTQLNGGAQYYASGWKTFGSGSTTTTMELLPLTYTFQVSYGGASQQLSQNVVTNPSVVFRTTLATVKLLSSVNTELSGGAQYYAGGWHTFGGGTTTTTMEMLPVTYTFQVSYVGGIQQLSQNVASNPNVVFRTTLVTMSLVSSTNAQLSGGAQYYASAWHAFGGGTTTTSMELLPLTYTFQITYAGASQQKSQNVATNPNVVFQTTLVTMKLLSSGNAELSGGAQYYATGWNTFGSGTTTATMEMLPLTYTFQVSYGGGTQQKSQNIATNVLVTFQTVQIHSDSGKCTSYYASGWRTFTQDMELLPGTYTFHFNDGTKDTSYTLVSGPVKHIH